MAISSAFCTSAKSEFFNAGHCFAATVTPTASVGSASTSATAVSSLAGVNVGMGVTGTSIAASTVVAAITGSNTMTLSAPTTGAIAGGTLTISGDTFKIALIKPGMAGTYGTGSVNYTDITGNTDEVSGTGYTATGLALTNVSPTVSGTTAFVNFSNPSWSTATFSTAGCMIYNSSVRQGGTSGTNTTGAGRAVAVYDFGGNQQVTSGTLTVLMPVAAASACSATVVLTV